MLTVITSLLRFHLDNDAANRKCRDNWNVVIMLVITNS